MTAYDTGKMIFFVRSILWDLHFPQEAATVLFEDNDGCTAMGNAQKPTTRTCHINIKNFILWMGWTQSYATGTYWYIYQHVGPYDEGLTDNTLPPTQQLYSWSHPTNVFSHLPFHHWNVYQSHCGHQTFCSAFLHYSYYRGSCSRSCFHLVWLPTQPTASHHWAWIVQSTISYIFTLCLFTLYTT
jgi:hypothetical protein